MPSIGSISAAVFLLSAFSSAQNDAIDLVAYVQAGVDQQSYYTNLATKTEFKSDIAAIVSVAPPSGVAQVQSDPVAFGYNLANPTIAPAWATAIPTPILNSLDKLYVNEDEVAYDVKLIATGSQASSIFANTAVPTSIKAAFTSDPIGFIGDLVAAGTAPAWATSIPAPLQTQIISVFNLELYTVIADYEASITYSTPPGYRLQTGASTSTPRTSTGTAVSTSGKPYYPSASGAACPTCPSCSPVTVVVTVTSGSPSTKPTPATSISRASTGLPSSSKATSASVGSLKTGASSGVAAFTGSKTGAPIAFTGAAAPMKTAAVGAALLFAGAGALLNA